MYNASDWVLGKIFYTKGNFIAEDVFDDSRLISVNVRFIFRDLKSQNVFLTKKGVIKIGTY